MPGIESHISSIGQAIQLAIAPVFLLTAIAGILNALMGRLARAVDRRRAAEIELRTAEGEQRERLLMELALVSKRTVLVLWSIGMAVVSALLVCLLIFTAFLGAFLFVDLSRSVAVLFIGAVAFLTICMVVLLREVLVAAESVHHSVWPRPEERMNATAEPK